MKNKHLASSQTSWFLYIRDFTLTLLRYQDYILSKNIFQKQPSRGVHTKRCSENMLQIYKRTPMPKCDFNKVAIEITFRHGCSPVNLLCYIFSERLFLRTPLDGFSQKITLMKASYILTGMGP